MDSSAVHSAPALTDRVALHRFRARAAALPEPAWFLQDYVADIFDERLKEVNRTFTDHVIVGGARDVVTTRFPNARHIRDEPVLNLTPCSADLILHYLSLHWADDPVGQLVQSFKALRADGLFIAALFGGRTLHELRASLAEAETRVSGGLSPRVAPLGEIRDLGALLQRAGFALPVADSISLTVEYASMFHLIRDLRAMGECNALEARPRSFSRRSVFEEAAVIYAREFGLASGRVPATFEIVFLTGWAPDPSQQKPMRPGSAEARLADALGVDERPTGERPDPRKV